jgi:hypothetical protein
LSSVQNSVLNSLSFERVFRENQRSASSQAIARVCTTVRMKSILGVGLKVKESIEEPFQIRDLVGKRSRWASCQSEMYDYCIRVCEYECLVTSFVFSIVDILGLVAPKWFFSS